MGLDPPPIPMENKKAEGFRRLTGPDPLENHKAILPAFSIGPSSARLLGVHRDPFCYLCFVCVSAILSYIFLAAFWSPAGKGLTSWLSCM